MTHQPEDAPYGGFGPDLPSCPPLSHGSSRLKSMTEDIGVVLSSPQVGCRCAVCSKEFSRQHVQLTVATGAARQQLCRGPAQVVFRPPRRATGSADVAAPTASSMRCLQSTSKNSLSSEPCGLWRCAHDPEPPERSLFGVARAMSVLAIAETAETSAE